MDPLVGCGASLGHFWRFLADSARQMLPAEEVSVEGRRFAVHRQLGEGGFSFVYLAREVPDARGEDFALKRVLLHEDEHVAAVEREMAVMRRFEHPNVLPLLHAEIEPRVPDAARRANLVFPAFPEGTLLDRATAHPEAEAFDTPQLLSVLNQVALALQRLHEGGAAGVPYAHRDLKPGNVLLETLDPSDPRARSIPGIIPGNEKEKLFRAVLMDFGSARPARVQVRSRQDAVALQELAAAECTAPFRAPELWDAPSRCDVDERVDVWSLGCVAFACVAGGRSPFEYSMAQAGGSLALAVLSGKFQWPEKARERVPREARAIAEFCLEKDWRARPSVAEVLEKIEDAADAVTTRRVKEKEMEMEMGKEKEKEKEKGAPGATNGPGGEEAGSEGAGEGGVVATVFAATE